MVEDPQKTEEELTKEHKRRFERSDQDPLEPGFQSAVDASLEREAREEGENLGYAGVKAEPVKKTEVSAPAPSAQGHHQDKGQERY